MTHVGKHAIVIGAGMGGLLAARALADHFDEVTIVERDALPDAPDPRKGVPQGRHTHGLLGRGREILEQSFPGLTDEMIARGAVPVDIVDGGLWFNYGVYLDQAPSGMLGIGVSRPMLEGSVRRRLLQLPNVRLRERHDALELVFDLNQARVTGARIKLRGGQNGTETLSADLVVDSSGRGSQSAAWLAALGYPKPREEHVQVDLGYVTRLYRRRPEHLEQLRGKHFVVMAACRPDFRFGVLLAQEGERWTVTVGGYLGDEAPTDEGGFLEYARALQKPEIFNVIRDAEPLSPPMPYRFSASLRRHYEELSRFPEGFLAYGDALCSFNPIYGQGMTVACAESMALRDCLAQGLSGIARRFFKAAGRVIDIPWQIAVGSDLQHPGVEGVRTAQVRFINWYIGKLFRAGHRDPVLATRFLEVANLMQQPPALLKPANALRVWRGNRTMAKAVPGGAAPAVGSAARTPSLN
jgi:2-polyprenyl-6-methoxyphenol hydroxylase-like FAD-dependent oxidoreductase